MQERSETIFLTAVGEANKRMLSSDGKPASIVSDNSKNGDIAFRAMFLGKAYDLKISRENVKNFYAKSLLETLS